MIVVLADDLSGAAELAGIAVRGGLSAELQTTFSPETNAEVICVASDTRSLPAEQAAEVVAAVTREIVAAKPAWIFKKCDSVLRGSVLAETRAMARAADKKRSLLLSANPSRGRVIRNGTYFIADRPLHETVFAHDPEHPRTTSLVSGLLGGDLTDIESPDVQTTADVLRHAASANDETLAVGGADFFEALLQLRVPPRALLPRPIEVPPGNALVVCGSAAAWPQRRDAALTQGIPVFALPHDVAAVVHTVKASPQTLIGIGDGPSTKGLPPAILVGQLAETVVELLRQTTVTHLLMEGGATTAAVMKALGWTRLRACNASVTGVGVMQPVNVSGPQLFIKPGSYPWPSEIWPRSGERR